MQIHYSLDENQSTASTRGDTFFRVNEWVAGPGFIGCDSEPGTEQNLTHEVLQRATVLVVAVLIISCYVHVLHFNSGWQYQLAPLNIEIVISL